MNENNNRINLEDLTKEIDGLTCIYQELVSVKFDPKKKENIFSKLFKNKNKVNLIDERNKQIEEKYIFLDDYVIILRACLRYYFLRIKFLIERMNKQYFSNIGEIQIEQDKLVVRQSVPGLLFSASLEGEPTFIEGEEKLFNQAKPSIYELVFYLRGFKNLCNQVPKEFSVSDKTTIKTTLDEKPNNANIIVKFGDMGFLDINMSQEKVQPSISFYSNNYEISKYLNNECHNLYYKIHIEREKVKELLELYHEIYPNNK